MNDEGLADAAAANPFRLARNHPAIATRATVANVSNVTGGRVAVGTTQILGVSFRWTGDVGGDP